MPVNEPVDNDHLAQVRVRLLAILRQIQLGKQPQVRIWLLAVLHQIRLSKELAAAIKANDAAAVSACLAEDADPNAYAVPDYRAPALLRAITQYYDPENPPDDRWDMWAPDESPGDEPHFGRMPGNIEIIEALLNAGAKIDKRDKCGTTALEAAVMFCDPSVVQFLLDHGADVNLQLPFHGTVLQTAVFGNREAAIVRVLLQAGANVNARGMFGETALSTVVRLMDKGRRASGYDVAEILLDHGADVTIAADSGKTVMYYLPQDLLSLLFSSRRERQLLRKIEFLRRAPR